MRWRNPTAVVEPVEESPVDCSYWQNQNDQLLAHLAAHEQMLATAADRIEITDRLLDRITELHSHDNLTGCCLTCGRAGPCKTTRILTGESK